MFYRSSITNQFRRYLNQIPEDFEMWLKVWKEITTSSYAKQPRYEARAGQSNPRLLDANLIHGFGLTSYQETMLGI